MPKSAKLPAPIKAFLLLLTPLAAALSACAPPIAAIPAACASLLPDTWRVPVRGAPLPEGSTVADWVSFADQQTGQLDKANERTLAAIGIVERCEARDRAAVRKVKRRLF